MTWNLFCDHSKRREDWERSIFVRLKEGGYRLRENILFHLYVSTSPCGDARLNSPYEITTDCKEKIFPLLFLLCASFVFFFSLRSVLLALFLCWQKVFHLRAKTPQALESVCVCVCATGAWCPGGRCAGKIRAWQGSSTLLGLCGSAGEYIP